MSRDVLVGPFATNDGRSKDGVRGGKAGGDGEGCKKVEAGNEGVDERSGDEPSLKHRGERSQRNPRSRKYRLGLSWEARWNGWKDVSNGDGTHPGHDWYEKEEDGFPVSFHVGFRELDADGEYTDRKDDSCELERYSIDRIFVVVSRAP